MFCVYIHCMLCIGGRGEGLAMLLGCVSFLHVYTVLPVFNCAEKPVKLGLPEMRIPQ